MRLDSLVRAAVEAGEGDGLSRAEMLSALVLAAEANGETLGQLLRAYRVAKVRAAIVSPGQSPGTEENVITLPTRKPGRR